MKCVGNTLFFDANESVAKAHVLVDFAPYSVAPYSERMMNGVYFNSERPPFGAEHPRKEIRFAKDLAQEHGIPLKALEVADAHYVAVMEHMDGTKADVTSVYGAVRKESGLQFEV